MGWMAEIRSPGNPLCKPSHGNKPPPTGQLVEERPRGKDLRPGGAAIRGRGAGMGRDDVPAERVELELGEDALDDRCRGLRGPAASQLPLGCKRQTGDASAAVARRLA